MRRLFSALLAMMLILSLTVPVHAEEAKSDDIVILYTNDVHTYIDGNLSYDTIAGVKTYLQGLYNHVLLVDAGDHIQGTAYGSMDKGKTIIDLMNAAGYDLATLGNHEFDYGMEGRINVTDYWAQFPYVSCNFYEEASGVKGDTVLPAYEIFELGEEKVAIIGITTPESFTKSTPAYFQDENGNYIYGIGGGTDGEELYADVQAAIDDAKADGATKIIALGHLGDDLSSKPWTSEETIANVTGLTAFIDGHSHSTVVGKNVDDEAGNNVLLTQTGEYFNAIGMMIIDSETGDISTELLAADNTITVSSTPDEEVKAIKEAWMTAVDEELGQKIGSAEVTFDNYDGEGNRLVRKQGTNTGAFAADALYFLFDNMDMDVDVAIMNGGGVRNKAITGDLTYKLCKEIHTFGNVACLQTITGQQLLDALEWGAKQAPDVEVGGFLHTAGVTYEVDGTIPSTVQADDKGVWIGGPTSEYRVKNVQIYNKEKQAYEPLDLTAAYNLAGYNYTLRDLGDGFAMFDGAVNVLDYVMEDYMVLANYVQAFENATIKADNSPLNAKYPGLKINYAEVTGDGRITVTAGEEEEWDGKIVIGGLDNNIWFTKYGNVYTDCTADNFVNELGLTWGDLVTVKFLDQELVLPVVPTYSYVDSGKPAIILEKTDKGTPTGYVSLAINMGNFGETYGLATKTTDADGNWSWTACEGVTFPVDVTYELAEKEGYMAEYILHELNRTNNREDYAHLSDEEFANFREVTTTGIGDNKLYRTSSPINPELGRNAYADAALEKAGVTVIMNLADDKATAESYEGFADTYYSKQNVIYLNLGVDFAADDFKEGLAKGLRFFAENEGVYAVHCTEGKDRAGFVNALLECLTGATYEEVVEDYMVTYINYYGVEKDSDKYNAIAQSNIIKTLESAFELTATAKTARAATALATADLAIEAEEYIKSLGLTDAEIAQLKENLCGKESSEPSTDEPSTEDTVTPPADDKNDKAPSTGDDGVSVYVIAGVAALMCMGAVLTIKKRNEY
ncbi:MAG: LPXTG cell wall anchor domain-containing protein [Lachnospiraceae bacterium]|nr:LPXTG cell wall anchor domain-containing protein [Lachnospiraceae bacterium]